MAKAGSPALGVGPETPRTGHPRLRASRPASAPSHRPQTDDSLIQKAFFRIGLDLMGPDDARELPFLPGSWTLLAEGLFFGENLARLNFPGEGTLEKLGDEGAQAADSPAPRNPREPPRPEIGPGGRRFGGASSASPPGGGAGRYPGPNTIPPLHGPGSPTRESRPCGHRNHTPPRNLDFSRRISTISWFSAVRMTPFTSVTSMERAGNFSRSLRFVSTRAGQNTISTLDKTSSRAGPSSKKETSHPPQLPVQYTASLISALRYEGDQGA